MGREESAHKPVEPTEAGDTAEEAAREESSRVSNLESELAETRDYLQSIQEQHEAANEELQAANEEVQSVNEEMGNCNPELNRLNSDLTNIQTSVHLAIVLLGRDLTIRRFSAEAAKEFNLLATDLGRPFSEVRHNLVFEERCLQTASAYAAPRPETSRQYDDRQSQESGGHAPEVVKSAPSIEGVIAEVIDNMRECEREVRGKDGRWHSLRVRPYLTLDNKVDGAVLVLVDITDLKRAEQTITAGRDYVEAILQTTRDPLLILDADLRVHTASQAFYDTFKVSPTESEGQLIYELGNRQWDLPKLRQLLEEILPRNSFFNNFEVRHHFERIGRRTMLLNARRLNDASGRPAKILLGIEDVTEVLSENAEKFKLLFDRSPLPKWVVELETLRFLDVKRHRGRSLRLQPGGPRGEGLKPVSRHSSLVPGHVTLRVRDTGIGLSADQIPRIFEMFTQVDTSLERSRGGLGIGLTLAKDLVELHGGTLEVHSAGPGQGSEFVVRLPLASDEKRVPIGDKAESGGDATATHSLPLTSGRKRILVVDDNVDSAESLTVLLGLTGNETRTAYDGLEALEEAASFRPDVILLDIGLPELNGYDVARKIREQSWGEKMTLVALTGWGQDEDRRRSKEAGFNHHLTKPVDLAALKKLLADSSELGA